MIVQASYSDVFQASGQGAGKQVASSAFEALRISHFCSDRESWVIGAMPQTPQFVEMIVAGVMSC